MVGILFKYLNHPNDGIIITVRIQNKVLEILRRLSITSSSDKAGSNNWCEKLMSAK